MSERFYPVPFAVRRKDEIQRMLYESEKSPSVQAAHDRAVINESVLQEVGVKDLLQDFNDSVLQVQSPLYQFDECVLQFHEKDRSLPLEISAARMINGYSFIWESKNENSMKVTPEGLLPLKYRLSVAVLDSSLYTFNVLAGHEDGDFNNEVMVERLKNDPVMFPVVIDTKTPRNGRQRVPLITSDNTFIPTEGGINHLQDWTRRSLYSFYFNQFSVPFAGRMNA